MPRFFVEKQNILGDRITVSGEDAKHISLSLRAKVGEQMCVCDAEGTDYECEISGITKNEVELKVLSQRKSAAEPDVFVTLYQALVKSDKFDFIVQKCTELGVSSIVPVVTERCISRPDEASLAKKTARWNKIAREAAMQSGRGIIPRVCEAVSFKEALREIGESDCGFVCYESQPHVPIDEIVNKSRTKGEIVTAAFLIGPEGGLSEAEAVSAEKCGVPLASLGPRILRTETAPLCASSAIMLLTGNLR